MRPPSLSPYSLRSRRAWPCTPVAGAGPRDDLMKTSVLALQGAVEQAGAAQMYVYPPASTVSPGGGLSIAFWPARTLDRTSHHAGDHARPLHV